MKNSIYLFRLLVALLLVSATLQVTIAQQETSYGKVDIQQKVNVQPPEQPAEMDSRELFSRIHSYEGNSNQFSYCEISDLATIINIAPYPSSYFVNAAEMVVGDQTKYYAIDHNGDAYLIDVTGGSETLLGNIVFTGVPLGMALEYSTGTYYIITDQDNLYTVDMNTLTSALVGNIGFSNGFMIGLTFDGDGNLWAYELIGDNFYSINKNTGAATLVGNIGFDANFGQGLGYDPVSDQVVMTAYNQTIFQAEYRTVNTTSGLSTFVGVIGPTGGNTQFSSCAIPAADEVPLAPWAIAIAISLIILATIIRFRRMG